MDGHGGTPERPRLRPDTESSPHDRRLGGLRGDPILPPQRGHPIPDPGPEPLGVSWLSNMRFTPESYGSIPRALAVHWFPGSESPLAGSRVAV